MHWNIFILSLYRMESLRIPRRISTFLLCWSGLQTRQCAQSSAWGWHCSPADHMFGGAGALSSRSGWLLHFQMLYWKVCSLMLIFLSRSHLRIANTWWTESRGRRSSHISNLKLMCDILIASQLWIINYSWHTYAEDIEAESLCYWFADQLIWKTVKAHVASELKVSLFFQLQYLETDRTKSILQKYVCYCNN